MNDTLNTLNIHFSIDQTFQNSNQMNHKTFDNYMHKTPKKTPITKDAQY